MADLLAAYGGWQGRTRRDHRAQLLARLGWRWCATGERKLLDEFLLARALEHDAPGLLLQLACNWLRADRIVRPPVDSLTRRIATARDAARSETYHRLEPLLAPPRPRQLDALLDVDPELGITRLAWLGRGATAATPEVLKAELDKLEFLRRHARPDPQPVRRADPYACNLGYTGMTDASGISEDQLAWTSQWYLRQDTLRRTPDWSTPTTELPLGEHTVDTAGQTLATFAIFQMAGLQFSPRIRDIGRLQLYRLGPVSGWRSRYPYAGPLLGQPIQTQLIAEHWNDLLRLVGTMKFGHTKGESPHALRHDLFFAHQGHVRRRHLDDQIDQALCLTLVTNACVLWTTTYLADVLDTLRAEGLDVGDEVAAHLTPAQHDHSTSTAPTASTSTPSSAVNDAGRCASQPDAAASPRKQPDSFRC